MDSFATDYGRAGVLDRERIRKLLVIGLVASLLTVASDMLLGWVDGLAADGSVQGMVNAYTGISDARIVASALMGLVGIFATCLAYFGVYRLLVGGDVAPFNAILAAWISIGNTLAFAGLLVTMPLARRNTVA